MSPRRTSSPPSPDLPVVRLDAVRVVLGAHEAVRGVDLDVAPAVLTVLTGANGAGKSTLLEVVAGVRRVTSGRVRRETGSVALVPQRTAVPDRLPVTVRDVATMGVWGRVGAWRRVGRDDARRVGESLERVGLEALARRPFSALSGGERQRALLAQGLARGAGLLVLDEPTTGLDAESRRRVVAAVADEVARGVAVVCATHDSDVVERAGRVVHLAEGRVVPAGAHS